MLIYEKITKNPGKQNIKHQKKYADEKMKETFFKGINMKNFKKIIIAAVLSAVSIVAFHAQSIEIQIIQHDNSQKNIRKPTEIIENTIMDNFFNDGRIITNAPIAAEFNNQMDSRIVKSAVKEASGGMCQYLIVLTIDYKKNAALNPATENLDLMDKIGWKLIDTQSGKEIASKNYKINKVSKANNSADGIKLLADELFSDILKSLK